MSDAGIYLAGGHLVEGVLHLPDCVELFVVGQSVESLGLVDALDLAEDGLDGVVVRAVAEVEDGYDPKPSVGSHRLLALVHREIVHEYHGHLVVVHEGDPVKELDELVTVEGLLLDREGLDASTLRDNRTAGNITPIDLLLVYIYVTVPVAPFGLADGRFGEIHLIQPQDAAARALLFLEVGNDLQPLLLSLLLIVPRNDLQLSDLLLLDLVLAVEAAQVMLGEDFVRVPSLEHSGPLIERRAGHSREGLAGSEVLDLILCE